MRAGAKALLLVGASFSENVINLILNNKKPEKFRIVAVKTPGSTDDERRAHLSDMAVITGAIPLFKAAGDTLSTALSPPPAVPASSMAGIRSIRGRVDTARRRGARRQLGEMRSGSPTSVRPSRYGSSAPCSA